VSAGRIFVWINTGQGTDWQVGMAMAEDGAYLASHVSSSLAWAKHDMGVTPHNGDNWKHAAYAAHYPEGFELIWVDHPKTHEGLMAAYALNQSKAVEP